MGVGVRPSLCGTVSFALTPRATVARAEPVVLAEPVVPAAVVLAAVVVPVARRRCASSKRSTNQRESDGRLRLQVPVWRFGVAAVVATRPRE